MTAVDHSFDISQLGGSRADTVDSRYVFTCSACGPLAVPDTTRTLRDLTEAALAHLGHRHLSTTTRSQT